MSSRDVWLYPAALVNAEGVPLDTIALKGLVIDCIVGVYPAERHLPQPLVVDLWLYLDTRRAASTGSLQQSVDYARLAGEVRFLLESCKFLLLETAAEALCRYVLAVPTDDVPRATVRAVAVRLTKPQALGDGGQPSLTVVRSASEVLLEVEEKPFGIVDIIHSSRGCGIYRLRIAPGRSIPVHVHHKMVESELVLGEGLLVQGRPVRPGTAFRWSRNLAHRYDNPTSTEKTVLCVDRPSFIPEDEVEVSEPDDGLVLPPAHHYYPYSHSDPGSAEDNS